MRRTIQSALLLGLSTLVAAVFKDEVGDVDFHHALVGVPQVETTFFHRPRKDDKASLLYTLGDVGVLGALNPSNGAVVWRQQVADGIATGGGHLRAPEGENWVAAAHGSKVHVWNALTGRNIWEMEFDGKVKDLEIMEMTETSRKDVLALFEHDGVTVLRRLHGGLGTVIWEFQEQSKDVPLQVSTNIASIYVIGLHGSPSSYSLRITSIDPATGGRSDHWTVGTKGDVAEPRDVMFVGANSAAPIVAWTNGGSTGPTKLNIHVLGTKSKQDFSLPTDAVSVQIHAPHLLQSQSHFLVHTRTKTGNKAEVYHINLKSNQIARAYELPHLGGRGAISTSSDGANVYFTRVTEDEIIIVASDSHSVLARWPFKAGSDIAPVHTVSEVIKKASGKDFAIRSAALTAEDDWVLIQNGEVGWTRHEGLSGAVAAVWAEAPEAESLAKVLAEEAHTNPMSAYIHRWTRHINNLQHLPAYLVSIPARVLNSLLGDGLVAQADGHRDQFGFSKTIVLVTSRGRVYGLDSGNGGKVAWSKLVFPQADGSSFDAVGIVSEDDKGTVTIRGSRGEYGVVNSANGEVLQSQIPETPISVSFTAAVDGAGGKVLVPIGADGAAAGAIHAEYTSDSTIVVRGSDNLSLKGLKFVTEDGKAVQKDIWTLEVGPGQTIVDVAAMPPHNPVASIGRVLADRQVNYKYLNPNAVVVAVADKSTLSLSLKLVDGVSGQVLASQTYDGVDANKDVSCTMSENWYACSFYGQYALEDGTERSIKGYQLASFDLYESATPNDRGPLGEAANYSSLEPVENPAGVPLPFVVSQTYIISSPLSKLSVSQTRQGITNRLLLAYVPEEHSILGLNRFWFDPRRVVDRDPTPAEMEAEGLPKYAPSIDIDPRALISHERDVVGVKQIVTTSAVVESTSLLVAYGVDVYGSRLSPSGTFDILGKGFNKTTLIGTVLALFAGVMFLAPMVRKKQIERLWQAIF